MIVRSTAVLVLLLSLLPRSGAAQSPPAGDVDLILKDAFCHSPHDNSTTGSVCSLGDTVQVTFANLSDWIRGGTRSSTTPVAW